MGSSSVRRFQCMALSGGIAQAAITQSVSTLISGLFDKPYSWSDPRERRGSNITPRILFLHGRPYFLPKFTSLGPCSVKFLLADYPPTLLTRFIAASKISWRSATSKEENNWLDMRGKDPVMCQSHRGVGFTYWIGLSISVPVIDRRKRSVGSRVHSWEWNTLRWFVECSREKHGSYTF